MDASGQSFPCILRLTPPPGAHVRVISDLHLGHERSEVPSVQELHALLDGVDILVVAGDFSEGREPLFMARAETLSHEFLTLCRKRGVELIRLAGNHDPQAGPLLLSLWGGKCAVMHGHALFREVSPWGWEYLYNKTLFRACIARHAERGDTLEERLRLSSEICQLVTPDLRRQDKVRSRYLRSLLHCFFPPERPLRIVWSWLTLGRRAEAFAQRYLPESEVLVLGHFHRAGHWQYGSRTIVNTGAWYKHATPMLADLKDGQLLAYHRAWPTKR